MASSMRLDPGWLQSQLGGSVALPELTPATAIVGLVAVILVPVLLSSLVGTRKPPHPDANGGSGFKFEAQLSADFIRNGIHILREARKKFSGKPFLLHSHQGLVTVLPNHMTGDVRNNRDLNFRKRVVMDGFTWLPGFSSASVLDRPDSLLQKVITKHLTKRLNTITGPLALEAIYAVEKALDTSAKDWKEVKIYDAVLDMVARLSSRIFLGPELCRNEEWLEITKTFTVHLTLATAKVRMFPVWMAPIVCLFDSSCRTVREMNVRAAKIVEPMVLNRREERAECAAKGVEPPVYNDLIEWIEIENGGKPYPILDMQLAMSFVATHTTSDLLCQTLLQLANAPEHIEPLRKELVEMLSTQGWKKTSLYGMKLLDSTIKEAQRTKPVQELSLLRVAEKDVTLSDGTLIRKGEKTVVEVSNMDPAKYENPAQFNPRRYLEMRETPGGEHKAQLVSTTADNVSFGFGIYACPGRFFAANEIKILLINLLLKYDWKMAPGTTTEPMYIAADPLINPEAKLMYKPRRPEIDLDNVNVESVDV